MSPERSPVRSSQPLPPPSLGWKLQHPSLCPALMGSPQLLSVPPASPQVLTALGRTWHPEHFTCARCGQELGAQPFFERDGQPYCEDDYHQAFAPCCGCERPVTGSYLSALEGVWHPECFVCTVSAGRLEGRPYCEQHFHQRQGSICHGCGRPVTGRCVTAAGRKYHPEHFTCTYCLRPLHKGTVRERGSKMYCQACHDKLFL
uniref:Leupaxin n=1 Tax=Amazona collaria TaxID=241587 RepID=A0A8B9G310_9PSIT